MPPRDPTPWPTLGFQVADAIERNLVHGPGDLRGQPARLDAEKRGLLARAYEVYPRDHPHSAGRRRFRRVAFSVRKGWSKTEMSAWIAAVELHPTGPVRCSGWTDDGQPIGCGVIDPYIPLVAYTEEQSEDLAYGALKVVLELSAWRDDFDIGIERIMRRGGDGKAVALAAAPDARDGARTTFSVFDETHRWTLPRLRQAHRTMLANLPKRRVADPWALEITTAPAPGEDSVAENTMEYARAVAQGERDDARLFFFHRQAGGADPIPLDTREQIRAAVVEASGPVAEWSDIDGIVDQWDDPTADRAYLERVWLNRLVQSSDRAFDANKWRELATPETTIPDGEHIALGFVGDQTEDGAGIIAVHIATGFSWVVGCWERPYKAVNWRVPAAELDAAMAGAFDRWDVFRLYARPEYFDTLIGTWAGRYGEKRVEAWDTKQPKRLGETILAYGNAILNADLTHDGDKRFAAHIGAAVRRDLRTLDDKGEHLHAIAKERPDSPHHVFLALAGAMAWRARLDAIATGETSKAWSYGAS